MATTLYFTNAGASIHRAGGYPGDQQPWFGSGWIPKALSTSRGSGVTSINAPTEISPSSLIHFGIQGHEWISEPVDADVTISGSITWNLRAEESNMGANAAINAAIYRMKATDLSLELIDLTARTTELGTSEAAANFSETPGAGVTLQKAIEFASLSVSMPQRRRW